MLYVPNCGSLEESAESDHLDSDPRGLIKIFEDPDPNELYFIGVDVSNGITNWSRDFRTEADIRIDNGAVEVIRLGQGEPDNQAAEYAAPVEPEDLADVVNFLGRLYAGRSEEGQAKVIIEIHPGPGMRTQKELITNYHYYNLYQAAAPDSIVYKPTQHYGWTATEKAIVDLWGRSSRHIKKGHVLINSKWLVEEMSNVARVKNKMWFAGVGTKHDDRLRAFMLAIWCAHSWDIDVDFGEQTEVKSTRVIDLQATDMTGDEWDDYAEDMWEVMAE